MREVNDDHVFDLRETVKKVSNYFLMFLKNPVQAIRFLPDWNWPTTLVLTGIFSALSGLLAGIFLSSFSQSFVGLFFFPLTTTVSVGIIAGFYYYSTFFILKRKLMYRKLYILVFLASLPSLALNVVATKLPPINLLGLFISSTLLTVGLADNFMINRKSVIKLVFTVYFVYVLLWVGSVLTRTSREAELIDQIQPKSLEILKEELKEMDN